MSNDPRQVVVVSGASGTIGSAIAQRFATCGWRVFGTTTYDDPPKSDDTRVDGYVSLHTCHAERIHEVRRFRQYVRMHAGHIDTLVIAHGAQPVTAPMTKLAPADFRMVMDIDVLGAFHICQAFGAMMVKQKRGSIILITSIHSQGAFPCRVPYSTAKTAIVGLGRGLAVEWAPYNVQVNMIAPGQVEGTRTRRLASDADVALMQARTPTGKLIMPDDVADAVMGLITMPAITGHTLVIDHGWTSSIAYKPHGHTRNTKETE